MNKKIILVPNQNKDLNLSQTKEIASFLKEKGFEIDIARNYKDQHGNYRYTSSFYDAEYIIAIGGDGTFLQAVNDFKFFKNTHFIGINLGTVGFLTTIEMVTYKKQLDELLKGNFIEETYSQIKVETKEDFEDECLNDVVIGRAGFARVIELEVYINNKLLYNFSGDGVLISTAIGSTAYNLSLGGPIVHPLSENMIITPIAPHSIGIKPIIIPNTFKVDVKIIGSHKKNNNEALLTCDGRNNNIFLSPGDIVSISKGSSISNLILKDFDYFQNLKNKLSH